MKQWLSAVVGLSFLASSSLNGIAQSPAPQPAYLSETPITAPHAMVVTIDHYATDAGVEVLKEGGNAVDAAVAVGFALAVVYPNAGNIGGGGFMLIRPASRKLAGGKPRFLDYREKAPAAATRDMYLDAKGNIIPHKSTRGEAASGVPGTVAGLTFAEKHYGRLGLAKVMAPAIRYAREGFVLDPEVAQLLHSSQMTPYADSRRIFQRDGDFYKPGETFKQPELASTLERIAADPDDFYRGKMAQQIADFEKANGGLITAQDLASYQCKERTPLVGHYHGLEVLTSPPPSSGGIVLLEILNILGGYDLPKLGPDRSPAQIHYITEAFRRAYMDRSDYLGDPDFNPHMPLKQMANPAYAAAWRTTIDPIKPSPSATLVRPAGFMPPAPDLAPIAHESNETTHFSVVDADGNAVSSTYTLNFYFGSGVTIGPLGFLLNDEMDDFTSKVGVPNGFGLIQGPANAIAPGKRPLSSMTPTIVSEPDHHFLFFKRPGQLRLVLGTPGGSTIITTVANDLISVVDNGLNIQQAADAPRFHHQYLPDILQFDKFFDPTTVAALKATGYKTMQQSEFDEKAPGVWGDSELIAVDPHKAPAKSTAC
ncbi:gamma-glutamyltransferase [Granulicella sp. 5B5]|uniref:gamma-glutamyltransferase n=1 Tax=Granulicella sp. 5B5 TaxID=1617967 RepID=UPI0021044C12|nr:gamma-glutamyltransferase [Granulicella sp. 5B5]